MDYDSAFGTGLRARLENATASANGTSVERGTDTPSDDIDLAPFYSLLRTDALIFRDFRPTAPLNWRLEVRRNIRRLSLGEQEGAR